MPTLNLKLFLRLLAVLVAIGGTLTGLYFYQVDRIPEALLWQANHAVEKGKADKAMAFMRQYLEFRPDDYDQAVKLGDMILERSRGYKDLNNAQFLFERVLRESPDRPDVAKKLVGLCIKMNRPGDALIHAERLLKQTPNDGDLLAQVGECQLAQAKYDEAYKSLDAAILYSPSNVRAHAQRANLMFKHFNKPEEAKAAVDQMIRLNATKPEAYLIRARFYRNENRFDECLADLDSIFKIEADHLEGLLLSAEVHQQKGELRRAKETLRRVITLAPRDVRGYRALSWLEVLSGNQAEAVAVLEKGATLLPSEPELLTPLADMWIQDGNTDKVQETIKKLESKKSLPQASYLRARLMMRQGQWNEALSTLEALRTEAVGNTYLAAQLNLLIASCHERRGDFEAQTEALKRVFTFDPANLGARIALANANLDAGRFDDAMKDYAQAAKSPLAGLGVKSTHLSLAMRMARNANAPAETWVKLESEIQTLSRQHPNVPDPVLLSAELASLRGDAEKGRTILQQACMKRPDDPRLWAAFASQVARFEGTIPAMRILGEAQLATGDSVDLRLARARLWADDFRAGRADRLQTLEELPANASDAERVRLLTGLNELMQLIGDDAGLLRTSRELLKANPKNVRQRLILGSAAARLGDMPTIAKLREESRKLDPATLKMIETSEALAFAREKPLTEKQQISFAELAKACLTLSPDHIDAHLLLATIARKRGDIKTARKHLQTATVLSESNLDAMRDRNRLAIAQFTPEELKSHFRSLTTDPRVSSARWRAATEFESAEELAKVLPLIAPTLGQKPRSMLWIAQKMEGVGRPADAIVLLQQLTQRFPKYLDGWVASLLTASRIGVDETNQVLSKAAKTLEKPMFHLLCAECGSALSRKIPGWSPPLESVAEFRAYAEACMIVCELRDRLEDALPVLKALEILKAASSDDVAWAKRMQAGIVAAKGSTAQKRQSIDILQASGQTSGTGESLDEDRSKLAVLLGTFRAATGENRRLVLKQMTDILERLTSGPKGTPNDWFHLAQLYRATGDRVQTRRTLEEVMKRDPKNLFFVAANVDDLLSESQYDAAKPYVELLIPGIHDIRVAGAACRYYTLINQPQAALDIVEKFVHTVDAGTTDGMLKQRQSAELLDNLTRLASSKGLSGSKALIAGACERYKSSLKGYPEAIGPMAALLAYDGQVQVAFEELERHKGNLSANALAVAGVSILRSGHATTRQFQTVKAWLEAALANEPESMAMKLNLGELHALRQDFNTAEQIYREILKADAKNLVALNNLAWILAPRSDSAEQALKYADKAIELHGATGEMLDTRARILISAGKFDQAVHDLQDAIGQSPTALRYFHLALAKLKMSKPDEARQIFKEAKTRGLDPKSIHPSDLPTFKILEGQS